jgi:hypothetical protein
MGAVAGLQVSARLSLAWRSRPSVAAESSRIARFRGGGFARSVRTVSRGQELCQAPTRDEPGKAEIDTANAERHAGVNVARYVGRRSCQQDAPRQT